ncbi:hypothetical protein DXG01_003591 [Tephrocybe rancida]|nr:hypothetical protein DXG01_003591 [Tephrocybe rancida]
MFRSPISDLDEGTLSPLTVDIAMDYEPPIPSAEQLENEKLITDAMFASDQHKAYDLEQNEKVRQALNIPIPISPTQGLQVTSGPNTFMSCMNSYRCIEDDNRILIPDLHLRIKADLHSIPNNSDHYFDSLFPLEGFPLAEYKKFMLSKGRGLCTPDCRVLAVGSLDGEFCIAKYLNKIVTSVAEFQHAQNPYHTPLRCWSPGKHNKLLGMGPWRAKPDLVLIPLCNGYRILDEHIFWPDILAVGEATVSSGQTDRMEETVNIKGFLMMFCQGDRVYAVILSMYKDTWYIHILDRQGKVPLGPFKYLDDTDKFLAVIIRLSFGSTTTIGLDSTMTCTEEDDKWTLQVKFVDENKLRFEPKYKNVPKPTDPTKTNLVAEVIYSYVGQNELMKRLGEKLDPEAIMKNKQCNIQEIMCDGHRYKVLGELFRSQGIVGRGMHVWHVEADDGSMYVMKDAFILASRRTEHGYLKRIRLMTKTKTIPPYLPKVEAYEIGQMTSDIRGQDLFSSNLLMGENAAKEQSQASNEARQHWRIVSLPVGLALGQVKNMVELLGVFLDITKAIKFLQDENCIHRDISFSNILLQVKPMQLDKFDWFCSPEGKQTNIKLNVLAGGYINIEMERTKVVPASQSGSVNHTTPPTPALLEMSPEGMSHTPRDGSAHHTPEAIEMLRGICMGTTPFMALPLLMHATHHRVRYDLESLFYVLIFYRTHYLSFGVVREFDLFAKLHRYAPMVSWFLLDGSFRDLDSIKAGHCHMMLDTQILDYLSPDFVLLKLLLKKLWLVLYPLAQCVGSQVESDDPSKQERDTLQPQDACEKFITIFETTILQDEIKFHKPSPIPTRKRRRGADPIIFPPPSLSESAGLSNSKRSCAAASSASTSSLSKGSSKKPATSRRSASKPKPPASSMEAPPSKRASSRGRTKGLKVCFLRYPSALSAPAQNSFTQ